MHADAGRPRPFGDETFDAIVCIDSISHVDAKAAVLQDWRRLL
ncbi:MAG: methyltransferase domain-containing protein [Actinomycetota bacterium]